MQTPIRRVAILGGGPSGASLGTWLARKGIAAVVFDRGKRPPIIVGESLVPAIVPYLRDLGVEDEVASYSIWKGGATFIYGTDYRLSLRFDEVRHARTTYSYNTPRDRFDATLLDAARRAGVHVVDGSATLERHGADGVRLSGESAEAARQALGGEPDLVVDAGGRTRTLARLLELPTTEGDRKDAALHAHLEGVEVEVEGNVHTDRLTHGWAWRIPLPGRVSLGFVVDRDHARKFGESAEEQFDGMLASEPVLKDWAVAGRRITPVVRYTNYQLRAERGVGPGWALAGDAFGFVDPVFSSGMLLALQSSELLARAIQKGTPRAFKAYEKEMRRRYATWHRIIGFYYDGRLLTLFRVGELVKETPVGRMLDFHFRKYMPRIFTGEGATSAYSNALVAFMVKHGLAGNDPRELEVR